MNSYLFTYNHHIQQRALGHLSPVDALKSWQKKKPELFLKRVYKQAELDIFRFFQSKQHSREQNGNA